MTGSRAPHTTSTGCAMAGKLLLDAIAERFGQRGENAPRAGTQIVSRNDGGETPGLTRYVRKHAREHDERIPMRGIHRRRVEHHAEGALRRPCHAFDDHLAAIRVADEYGGADVPRVEPAREGARMIRHAERVRGRGAAAEAGEIQPSDGVRLGEPRHRRLHVPRGDAESMDEDDRRSGDSRTRWLGDPPVNAQTIDLVPHRKQFHGVQATSAAA